MELNPYRRGLGSLPDSSRLSLPIIHHLHAVEHLSVRQPVAGKEGFNPLLLGGRKRRMGLNQAHASPSGG